MKKRSIILLAISIILISIFMFCPRYRSLNELVFNDFKSNETSLIFLTPSNQIIYKHTQYKEEILNLERYLKEIEVRKITQSKFYKTTIDEYYLINICINSGLLYQITLYNNYIRVTDTTKGKDITMYFKMKNPVTMDFIEKYFNSLENTN